MSRQREWQIKMKAAGRCQQCGAPSYGALLCFKHLEKVRNYYRKKLKLTAWQPGGPGRPLKFQNSTT